MTTIITNKIRFTRLDRRMVQVRGQGFNEIFDIRDFQPASTDLDFLLACRDFVAYNSPRNWLGDKF